MHCPLIAEYFSAQREDEGAGLTVVHSRTNDLARGVDGDCVEEHPRGVGDGVVQVDQRGRDGHVAPREMTHAGFRITAISAAAASGPRPRAPPADTACRALTPILRRARDCP